MIMADESILAVPTDRLLLDQAAFGAMVGMATYAASVNPLPGETPVDVTPEPGEVL